MSVARVTEITAALPKSFDDAIRAGLAGANKTLKNVNRHLKQESGGRRKERISEYRVRMKVTFVLND